MNERPNDSLAFFIWKSRRLIKLELMFQHN
jgi:hypothetical protein